MTTFKEIRGNLIKSTSTDPANPQEGQIWYNSTSQVLKGYLDLGGTWSAGGNLNSPRALAGSVNGTQTSSLAFGGEGGGGLTTNSETYDGTSWTEGNNMVTARKLQGGMGTAAAALGAGGYSGGALTNSEEYDGTSWAEGNNLNTGRDLQAGAGTQTAGLMMCGRDVPVTPTAATEEYDGTSWTNVTSAPTARASLAGLGLQTAALLIGGSPYSSAVLSYNGSTYSTEGSLNTGRSGLGGAGTTTAGLAIGGNLPPSGAATGITELYNGTSWTTTGSLATSRARLGTSGTQTAGLAFGGGPYTASTEEFANITLATKTFTTS